MSSDAVAATRSAAPVLTTVPLHAAARGPRFEIDTSWPKPLPEGWINGQLPCVCVDNDDNVLIADSDNHVIRKYLPRENKILLVAGTGKSGKAVSRNPLETELNQPHGVNVDKQGRVYIADSLNGRVLRIEQ